MMRDILLQNGFTDSGECPVCGGRGWLYTKSGATVKVKLQPEALRYPSDQRKTMEIGTAVMTHRGEKILIKKGVDLQLVLKNRGLAKPIEA